MHFHIVLTALRDFFSFLKMPFSFPKQHLKYKPCVNKHQNRNKSFTCLYFAFACLYVASCFT